MTILLYHDLKPDVAEKHFLVLAQRYNCVSLRDYVEARENGSVNQLPPKTLIITFDDGYRGNYDLLPLFRKYSFTPTIFLCTGIINTPHHFWFLHEMSEATRQYLKEIPDEARKNCLKDLGFEETSPFGDRHALSKNEIQEMIPFVEFQSHTICHPILPMCGNQEAGDEILKSKLNLEEQYGLDVYALAYPNGDFTEREIFSARHAGYRCGLTLEAGFNSEKTDLFKLRRICVSDKAGVNELLIRVCGLWDFLKRALSIKGIFQGNSTEDWGRPWSATARQLVQFASLGMLGTIGHYCTLIFLVQTLKVSPVAASFSGFLVGAIINYLLNYRFTFHSSKPHQVALTKFLTIALVGIVLNTAIMAFTTKALHLHYLLAQIIATGCVLGWNFSGNRLWTFKEKDREKVG